MDAKSPSDVKTLRGHIYGLITWWSSEILLLTERQLILRIVTLSFGFNLVGLVLLALFILGARFWLNMVPIIPHWTALRRKVFRGGL